MLEIARVVAIHPGDHSLDALLLRTGARAVGVPVITQGASTTTGQSDLPTMTAPAGEARWNVAARTEQDVLVVLAPTAGGHWVALGFLFPQINAVLSGTPGAKVYRHGSGAWHSIGLDGTVTIGHPSGATATMGPTLDGGSPVGGDVDGRWQHGGANAAAAVGLRVAMPSGAVFTIAPDGKATLKAIGEAIIDTPLASFTGDIVAEGDVIAGTISLREHTHYAPDGGGETSEPGGGAPAPPDEL